MNSTRLLVTARHVIFTPDRSENEHFDHKIDSQRRYNVTLFGDAAFKKCLESIQVEMKGKAIIAQYYEEQCIGATEGMDDSAANKEHKRVKVKLDEAIEAMEVLKPFHQYVSTRWATSERRVLGHVVLSPAISVGSSSEGYTEDWAVIEMDASKVDVNNFTGNTIHLDTRVSVPEFTRMMYNNPWNGQSFTYPGDHLLRVKRIIPDEPALLSAVTTRFTPTPVTTMMAKPKPPKNGLSSRST